MISLKLGIHFFSFMSNNYRSCKYSLFPKREQPFTLFFSKEIIDLQL